MIKAHPGRLSAMVLPYVWEMPLLELLASIFSQKFKDLEKYEIVMKTIQRPELNEHNRLGLYSYTFIILSSSYIILSSSYIILSSSYIILSSYFHHTFIILSSFSNSVVQRIELSF
jgi:hypothetical protein